MAIIGNPLPANFQTPPSVVRFNGDGSDEVTGGYMYFHYAPDKYSFDKECRRLLENISFMMYYVQIEA